MASIITSEIYKNDYISDSAGVCAINGKSLCYDARKVLLKFGYSSKVLNGHCSKVITEDLIKEHDVVIAVTENIKNVLIEKYGDYKSKITCFSEDILSPLEGDEIAFEECFYQLCSEIEKILYPGGCSKWKSKSEE